MKKVIFFLIILLSTIQLHSQIMKERMDSLVHYYTLAVTDSSKKAALSFFDFFPDDFNTFDSIYGYGVGCKNKDEANNSSNFSPLYFDAINHICLFANIGGVVPSKKYYRKMINICIDGYWQADAVNYFKHCLKAHLWNEPDSNSFGLNPNSYYNADTLLMVLETYCDQDISSFWHFYYDELIISYIKSLYEKTDALLDNYPKLKQLMYQEYKKSIEFESEEEKQN